MKRRHVICVSLMAVVSCGTLREADEPITPNPDAGVADANAVDRDASDALEGGPSEDASPIDPRPSSCSEADCPVETISDEPNLGALALSNGNVYFVQLQGGTGGIVTQCPKTGCGEFPVDMASRRPERLVAIGARVYWTEGRSLVECPSGGCATTIATILTESNLITDLTGNVYALVWRTASAPERLRACPWTDCKASTVVTVRTETIGTGIAIGPNVLAWIDGEDTVKACPFTVPAACDSPIALGKGIGDIAIGGTTVYWAAAGEIRSCEVTGCDAPTRVARSDAPRATAVDASHVYWRDDTLRQLLRCPRTGCEQPETVASDVDGNATSSLALDEDSVYWTTRRGLFRRKK